MILEYYVMRNEAGHILHQFRDVQPGEEPVIFRMEGNKPQTCVAFFPYSSANHGKIVCYAHLGQHSEASIHYYGKTRPAKPTQYAELLVELRGIYESGPDAVRLVIRKRLPHDWRDHAWKRSYDSITGGKK